MAQGISNKIESRVYWAIRLKLVSPLGVSSGENYFSDADVIRDGGGKAFIPGSSIAGAIRNYWNKKKKEDCIMGFSDGNQGRMSALYVSDVSFTTDPVLSVRDGIRLGEDKIVFSTGKFDQEIIETSAEAVLYLEYTHREQSEKINILEEMNQIFLGIEQGEIRFGSKKNRGFGKCKIIEVYRAEFAKEQVEDWLNFMENHKNNLLKEKYLLKNWKEKSKEKKNQYITIKVPLCLKGGISIRKYSTRAHQADYEHISCNGQPVIPGSSWNGAIRAAVKKFLMELQVKEPETVLKNWFGYVDAKEAAQSKIRISESIIKDGRWLTTTRNKINRFSAATVDGALYSEKSYYGGNTTLEIQVKKDSEKEYEALIGLLLYVILDIQKGYLTVGGETSIGHGLFTACEKKEVTWSEEVNIDVCKKAFYLSIAMWREA